MKRLLLILLACLCLTGMAWGQTPDRGFDFDLWPNGLPNSNGIDTTNTYDDATFNYKPRLRIFLPEPTKATGRAIICCPGGSYRQLSPVNEAVGWERFCNDLGIALFVLKYRMPHGVTEVPISDAQEALRVVREHAQEWRINPDEVGIMGFSAGGHLASTMCTHGDAKTRPNFQILFYPVITFDKETTHANTRKNLIGENPAKATVELYSNDLQVDENTPRTIILLSEDDKTVPPENSVRYYTALHKKGIPVSLHIYPSGGHGYGCSPRFPYWQEMEADLRSWLKSF